MGREDRLHFDTLAAQAGLRVRVGDSISTSPPIDPSTTFTADSIDEVHRALTAEGGGYAYARNANPTVSGLEHAMSLLEGAEDVVAFGSGMAAIAGAFQSLQLWPGDTVLASGDLYGVTRSLFAQQAQHEIQTTYVDVFDLEEVERALESTRARALYFETITNPLLRVPDSAALIDAGRRHGAAVIIDNTFATPFLFRPLAIGADLVIHSATKYIAGHGDVVAGLVAGARVLTGRVRDARTVNGGILSPFEAWLTLRGVRTLPLRLTRQSESALEIARRLSEQTWVSRVYYPGLPDHPQHDIARQEFGGLYGGMIAFDLDAGEQETLAFLDALELITPGTSLGDVESLVLYPPLSSHRTLTPEQRSGAGIGAGLVRMSVGLENPRDLMDDLEGAARRAALASRIASQS